MIPVNTDLCKVGSKFVTQLKLKHWNFLPTCTFFNGHEKQRHTVHANVTKSDIQCFTSLKQEKQFTTRKSCALRKYPCIGLKQLNSYQCRRNYHGQRNLSSLNLPTIREYHAVASLSITNEQKSVQLQGKRNISSDRLYQFYPFDINSPVVEFVCNVFINLHDVSGLPMWAVIMMTGVVGKIMLSPLTIIQNRNTVKLQSLPVVFDKAEEMVKQHVSGYVQHTDWSEEKRKKKEQHMLEEYKKNLMLRLNCSLLKGPIVVTNNLLFVLYGMRGVRSLCGGAMQMEAVGPQECMHTEGLLWFSDLTTPDMILPVIACLILYIDIEMKFSVIAATEHKMHNKFSKHLEYLLKGLTLCLIPIGCIQPAGVVCLWIGMFSTQVAMNCFLRMPKFARIAKPEVFADIKKKSETATPNRDMLKSVYERYQKLFSNIVNYMIGSNSK